jgi:hypothetical protein
MNFASAWLEKNAIFPELVSDPPDNETGIIVVIPAYDEPGIHSLLDSLSACDKPGCATEVIVIINAPKGAKEVSLLNNKHTFENIESWKKKADCFFRLFAFNADQPSIKDWGAGLARKTGMDEAVRRFNTIDKPEGVVVSLDADCLVAKNYFTAIYNDLLQRKDRSACSIYFEHPLSGAFSDRIYKNITMYELHLRYYVQGLKYSGFPNAFHTIGSAIAFKAGKYVKAGGMNRKQAGEDFYFIQKLTGMEGYFNLNTTTVFPSPRESSRVPFGTGPAIGRLMEDKEGELLTYNIGSFSELKYLFTRISGLFRQSARVIEEFYRNMSPGLRSSMNENDWVEKISEININTSTSESFVKRFFSWFNMFRIVRYMNHVHNNIFEKQDVTEAASKLLSLMGHHVASVEPGDLLEFYRFLDRRD